MASDTVIVGVRLPQEDCDFLDELAVKNMSYRTTTATRLLRDKIAELRRITVAENDTTENTEGEESQNGNPQ